MAQGHSVSKCQSRNYNPSPASQPRAIPLLSAFQATVVPAKHPGVVCSTFHSPQFSFLLSSRQHRAKEGVPGVLGTQQPRGQPWGCRGDAPAPVFGNLPAEPPSSFLVSVLEFLCSQCISLEVCPLRVAMVTILVLHARKSRGTCWSHHQNLSL